MSHDIVDKVNQSALERSSLRLKGFPGFSLVGWMLSQGKEVADDE